MSTFPLHCNRYVDVFCGRGNIYFAAAQLRYYPRYWLNDWRTAPFLRALRHPDYVMPSHITNDLYRRIQAADKRGEATVFLSHKYPHRRVSVHLLAQIVSWSGGFLDDTGPKRRGWRAPSVQGFLGSVIRAHHVMQFAPPRITQWDYRRVLAECREGDLVYIDPEYLNANVDYKGPPVDYPQLVQTLLRAKFKWVLSESGDPIAPVYYPLGAPLLKEVRHTINSSHTTGGRRPWRWEALWTNFEPLMIDSQRIRRALKKALPKGEEEAQEVSDPQRWENDLEQVVRYHDARSLMAEMKVGELLDRLRKQRDEIDRTISTITAARNAGPAKKGGSHHKKVAPAKKHTLSAAARKRIGDAQRKRWAKQKAGEKKG